MKKFCCFILVQLSCVSLNAQPEESLKFVTHSMSAEFAEGIVSYLIVHG